MSDDDESSPLGFADEPPGASPPEPEVEAPRRRKRRQKSAKSSEVREEHGDRILDRPDHVPAVPWWLAPAIVFTIGFVLCLVPIGYVALHLGVKSGFLVMLGIFVAVIVEIVGVTVLLSIVGNFFGIEYGPVRESLVKLAAVVTIIDGMTGTFAVCNSPCAMMMAAVLGAGIFHALFKLQLHETLLSVAGMVFFAFLLNGIVLSMLISRAMPQMQ